MRMSVSTTSGRSRSIVSSSASMSRAGRHDLEVGAPAEQLLQPLADEEVVLGQDDPHGHRREG